MNRFKYIVCFIYDLSIVKTIIVNFSVFGFSKTALKMPILIFKHTEFNFGGIIMGGGKILLKSKPSFGLIRIGPFRNNIYSKRHEYTKVSIDGTIVFWGRATFYSGSRVLVLKEGVLNVGKDFEIGSQTTIITAKNISFGNNVMISWDTLIMDTDLHPIYSLEKLVNTHRDIVVGDNVWIGCKCCVLKGSVIPNGNIISAASVVTHKHVQENAILSSNCVLKTDIVWKRELYI